MVFRLQGKSYYTVKQASRILGMKEQSVRRLLTNNEIQFLKVGSSVLIPLDELEKRLGPQNEEIRTHKIAAKYQEMLERTSQIAELKNGEHIFYGPEGEVLMIARPVETTPAVESNYNGESPTESEK